MKAHKRHERAQRSRVRKWIEDNYSFVNQAQRTDEEIGKELWRAKHAEASSEYKMSRCSYRLPFRLYRGDGILLDVPMSQQPSVERDASQQYQRRLDLSRIKRAQEPGIPGTVDILQWYAAYLKVDDMRHPEKQAPMTRDAKQDYYRDLAIDFYHVCGYSIGDSVTRAYSPEGDELIRYLSDDKRHPLNRSLEYYECELSSAV